MCKHFSLYPLSDIQHIREPLYAMLGQALRASARDGGNLHGTGVGNILANGEFAIHKTGKAALLATTNNEWMTMLDGLNFVNPVIGHVRKASSNIQDNKKVWPDEDAHPFEVGDILLAHNGTIKNHAEIVKKNDLTKGMIDSFAIAELVSKLDNLSVDNLNTVTKQLDGSYALVMQHRHDPTRLILCRHDRPLWFGTVGKDENLMGVVSTSDTIGAFAVRETNEAARMMWRTSLWDTWSFAALEVDTWYEITNTGNGMVKLGDLDVFKPIPPKVTPGTSLMVGTRNFRRDATLGSHERFGCVDEILRLLKVLPLTAAEFRYYYEELVGLGVRTVMEELTIKDVVDFTLEDVLTDDKLRGHLEGLLDMDIMLGEEGNYTINRRVLRG